MHQNGPFSSRKSKYFCRGAASLSSDRQHLSYDVCLEVRGEIIRTVLFCIVYCTVHSHISTLRWAVLAVLWIGLYHTGPISLCVDLCLSVCILRVFVSYCIYVVGLLLWARWVDLAQASWCDWSLILRTHLPSVLWHCWMGHLTQKTPFPIWPITCLVGR